MSLIAWNMPLSCLCSILVTQKNELTRKENRVAKVYISHPMELVVSCLSSILAFDVSEGSIGEGGEILVKKRTVHKTRLTYVNGGNRMILGLLRGGDFSEEKSKAARTIGSINSIDYRVGLCIVV